MTILFGGIAAVAVILILLLVPRTYFIGKAGPEQTQLAFDSLLLGFEYDSTSQVNTCRILGIPFHYNRRKDRKLEDVAQTVKSSFKSFRRMSKKSEKTDASKPGAKGLWINRRLELDIVKRFGRLVLRLAKTGRIDRLDAHITIASEDAMWTGVIFGALQPLLLINAPPRRNIIINPDFSKQSPEIIAGWAFSIRPVKLFWILGIWLITLPWLRILRAKRDF